MLFVPKLSRKQTAVLQAGFSFVLIGYRWRYVTSFFPTGIGYVKDLPFAVGFFDQLECVDSAMAECFANIETIPTPHLCEVAVHLDLDIPDRFRPLFFVRRSNGVEKSFEARLLSQRDRTFLIPGDGSHCG